jgi:alpha-L-fucosidase
MHTPFHRDVVKELSAACRKQGIAFGTYYSVTDWYDPDWPVTSPRGKVKRDKYDLDAYEKYLQGQIAELIKNYGPLITIWNDVPAMYGKRGADTIRLVRSLQPDILINDRTGAGGDYRTPEQHLGGFDIDHPWESCMTVSAHNHWAWGGANDGVKPLRAILKMLIGGAGGDGNILLNVGPRPDGVIDPEQAGRLKDVGDWLAKYGESIYGARGGPYKPGDWGASTRKGNRIYIHVLKWNGDPLQLPALPAKITAATVLTGGTVDFKQTDAALTLTVPIAARAEIDTLIALDIDKPAMGIAPIDTVSTLQASK